MQKTVKTEIVQAARAYMQEHSLSQKHMADNSGINISYISAMLMGELAINSGEKSTVIADKWFAHLAKYIGYNYQKEYWPFVHTHEFVQIVSVLETAKENGFTNVVICPTGKGKTHAVGKFEKKHPMHTYKLTVSRLHKISEILNDLADMLGLPVINSNAVKLKRIITKLRDVRLSGGDPIIIIDEAENLTLPVLQLLKALYDGVKDYCSVVLIGTDQLTLKLDRMEARDREGMPQFCRRFRAGRREILPANDFTPFFEKLGISERGLIALCTQLARNYGELRDYLEPALREADKMGHELTETLFRQFHYLPIPAKLTR